MPKTDTDPRLILASKSPRRRYLLKQAGLTFTVIPGNFDERTVPMSSPPEYVRKLAESKAVDVARRYPNSWVIGADTMVSIGDRILGKPVSDNDARGMLQRLSDRIHQVYTGYCICRRSENRLYSDTVMTDVRFKALTADEIAWYIQTREPFDKAGAYAIQGLGTFLVKSINGSYTNVVGLPICEVIEFLIREKVISF
ncbi:MAG: Maf family protein [Desulfobacterales bacterium]|jgi:septum formation protein